jgi:(S)-2-hydroxyglutarate dehydrogenase
VPLPDAIEKRARLNRAPDLARIGSDELAEIEPAALAVSAIHSPHTAIVDYTAVANVRVGDIEAVGGQIRLSDRPVRVRERSSGVDTELASGTILKAAKLVVCAGLGTRWPGCSAGRGRCGSCRSAARTGGSSSPRADW